MPAPKLKKEDVHHIRIAHSEGATQAKLAEIYGVSPGTIRNAITGKTYQDAPGPIYTPLKRHNFSGSAIRSIREEYALGTSQHDLAETHDCSRSLIAQIVRGEIYCDAPGPTNVDPSDRIGGWNKRITDEEIEEIRARRRSGEEFLSIADDFGISDSYARQIAVGERRADCGSSIVTPVKMTADRQKVIRYTRWAFGETTREFADRVGVAPSTVSTWEAGGVSHVQEFTWEEIARLARMKGVDPESPKRVMTSRKARNLIQEMSSHLWDSPMSVSDIIGVDPKTINRWLNDGYGPSVHGHLAIRSAAQHLGLWSPPDPVDEPEPEPEPVELSEHDEKQIGVLYDAGTHPSDISMMYDVDLSRVMEIIRR